MDTQAIQNALTDTLGELISIRNDIDEPLHEVLDRLDDFDEVRTFAETDILTTDHGLVITCKDGSEFQVTIVQSR